MVNTYSIAQRVNPHNNQVEIQKTILTDYLMYLDSTLQNVDDTILIETEIEIPQLNKIKVKYVSNSGVYIWNRGDSYYSISKTIQWESDTSICVSINLHENILEYDKKKKKPLSRRYPIINNETNYYVFFNCFTKEWKLQDRQKIDAQFPYRNESNWVVMDSTSVRQFINSLRNPKQGRFIINSIRTVGQTDSTWINEHDLEYLISLIDSKEKSRCIVQSISSQRADWDDISTIGAQVTQILNCHIKGNPYPKSLNYCPNENEELKKEILNWWNNREN